MIAFVQGEFIPEERAVVSIFDRAFRYGDALFEAVLVFNGKMFRWPQHFQRLERSAHFLKIALPYSAGELLASARELISRNGLADCVLRLQLSRGIGPRGYAPSGEEKPLVVMSLHPAPSRESLRGVTWKLTVSSFRIPANDLLANHKTCSRLLHVCVAAEARERGADESLIVNTNNEVTEGSGSNVFWIDRGTVCTTPLAEGVLPGVTRAAVLEVCDALGIARAERLVRPEQLPTMDGIFLSFTSRGLVEAESLNGTPLRRSTLTTRLQQEFEALLARECA
jgi:branched-subunit amino acid aminotransferase/4-amino-4-deoxychorismate lyase